MIKTKENAVKFIMQEGTETQRVVAKYLLGEKSHDEVIDQFRRFQNKDGGWANSLEIEYQGTISSIMTTITALGYLYLFGLKESELYAKTIKYLEETQKADGSWDELKEISQFEIPIHYQPEKFIAYRTGMLIKWLNRLNYENKAVIERAINFMIVNYENDTVEKDFWSPVGYINAFSELGYAKKMPEIIEWAIGIIAPSQASPMSQEELPNKSQESPVPQEELSNTSQALPALQEKLPWVRIVGMIHDDDQMIYVIRDKIVEAIKNNQLPTGGWPHQFGTYNEVWAAVLILRYLNIVENNS